VNRTPFIAGLLCLAAARLYGEVTDADWPTFGHGVQRQHSTKHQLADRLSPEWETRFPRPRPAFWSEPQLAIDWAYEPVLVANTVYLGLNSTDEIVALDLATGKKKWSFYALGPVRRPPAFSEGKLYFGSDAGYCHCLDAADGRLVWKFYAAHMHKYVLGNGRVISQWPVRSDVLVADGRVYFGSGQWPFMGTYLYCLDAETGAVVWRNASSSFFPSQHPHGQTGISGLSPLGTIALCGDTLVVSNGRARPMRFSAATGERLRFESGWQHGCTKVVGAGDKYLNGAYLFDLKTCTLGYQLMTREDSAHPLYLKSWMVRPVVEENSAWTPGQKVRRWQLDSRSMPSVDCSDRLRYDYPYKQFGKHGSLGSVTLEKAPQCDRLWIKAGNQLFASRENKLLALRATDGSELWSQDLGAEIGSVIAGQGKLLVSTMDGRLTCFGQKGGLRRNEYVATKPLTVPETAKHRAAKMLAAAKQKRGCVLVAGVTDGSLVKALAQEPFYRVVTIDADAEKLAKLHRQLVDAGLHGTNVDLVCGSPAGLPPYLMKMICSERDLSALEPRVVFDKLRPYGGRACYESTEIAGKLREAALPGAKVVVSAGMTMLGREGALAGSSWWTHDCASPGHTLASEDRAVRGPLGVTWYGGPAAGNFFNNRHDGAPRSQVVEGRLYCQKHDLLTCYDAYTGELLWQREFGGLSGILKSRGHPFTPPAFVVLGGNMVTQPDSVYIETGDKCLVLDALTGEPKRELRLPNNAKWGCLQLLDDVLVVLGDTLLNEEKTEPKEKWQKGLVHRYGFGTDPWNGGVHRALFALDRHSGDLLWQRPAKYAYRSSGIALGNSKVFVLDFAPDAVVQRFRRRGVSGSGDRTRLLALDIKTGREIWEKAETNVGSWLGYSRQADVLLGVPDGTLHGYDTVDLHAWRGSDGSFLYKTPVRHAMGVHIVGDRFVASRVHDIHTGSDLGFNLTHGRGCLAIAGPTMLTLRTSSSGYIDLSDQRHGLVTLPGFRTSCFGSLVPADGLLNAPNEGTGCVCNYNMYTPLALAQMPDVDLWGAATVMASDDRLGLNFGAPGDRVSQTGTSFFQFPMTAWPNRRGMCVVQEKKRAEKNRGLLVETVPDELTIFEHRSTVLTGQTLAWVGASGVTGLEELRFEVTRSLAMDRVTLRFYFCEHEVTAIGQRVFDILIGDVPVLAGLDVFREARGARKMLVKEVRNLDLKGLRITFKPAVGSQIKESLLCGLEIIREK